MNDDDEANINLAAVWHGIPVLDSNGEVFSRKGDARHCNFGDFTHIPTKAKRMKKTALTRLNSLELLQGGPDELEGRPYDFVIQ